VLTSSPLEFSQNTTSEFHKVA